MVGCRWLVFSADHGSLCPFTAARSPFLPFRNLIKARIDSKVTFSVCAIGVREERKAKGE